MTEPSDPTRVDLPPAGPPAGAGGPAAPDRRPWILAGVLGAIVLVLLAVILLGGDEDDPVDAVAQETTTSAAPGSADPSTSTSSAASATTEPPSTTEAPTTAPPVTTAPGVDPATCDAVGDDPLAVEAVALAVYDAWTRDDEACAAPLMTDDARSSLFARPGAGAQDVFQGCFEEQVPDPHHLCSFTYEGGATSYRLVFSETDGWLVYEVFQTAD